MVANVVARLAPAAINVVFTPELTATISTINIVKSVLNNCSMVCEFAIAFIFPLPLKNPLNTQTIATKKIAGDNATKVNSASGIASQTFAI